MRTASFLTNILRAWGFTLKKDDQNLHQLSVPFDLLLVDGGAAKARSDSMGPWDHGLLASAWVLTLACDCLRLLAAGAGGRDHRAMSTDLPFNFVDSDGAIVAKEEC